MSYSGSRNANVRLFNGGINALEYWIGNSLLSARHILNDSTVTGATVKAALDTLSSASSAVFPFVAAGLAEQDLVSYDATAGTWKNRTVAAALSGKVTSTMVSNASAVVGATVTAALNTLNTAIGSVLSPYVGTSLAEQDLVSYDASGARWVNRTVANALKGTGTDSLVAGTGSFAAGADSIVIGRSAGAAINTGVNNIAIGLDALDEATAAVNSLIAIGANTITGAVTAAAGGSVAVGAQALTGLTSGTATAVGLNAGSNITTGLRNSLFGMSTASASGASDNTFIGNAVGSSAVGSQNTAVGSLAFNSASAAVTQCVAIGYNALSGALTVGAAGTTAIGSQALAVLTSGSSNTAVGGLSMAAATSAYSNTAVGQTTLQTLTDGYNNAVLGQAVASGSTSVCELAAVGSGALLGALTTAANGAVAIGYSSLALLTSGARNVAVGYQAGNIITTGSDMTILGYDADGDNAARSGCVVLGSGALATVNNTLVIRVGNSATTELKSTLAVTTNVTTAIGTETFLPVIINGVTYKIALHS